MLHEYPFSISWIFSILASLISTASFCGPVTYHGEFKYQQEWLSGRDGGLRLGAHTFGNVHFLTTLIFVPSNERCVQPVHIVVIVYTLLLGYNPHTVPADAHLMSLPPSVHPRISCWRSRGAPKDLLQTREPKWSVFFWSTVSHLKTTQREQSLALFIFCFSAFFLFFFPAPKSKVRKKDCQKSWCSDERPVPFGDLDRTPDWEPLALLVMFICRCYCVGKWCLLSCHLLC